MTQAQIQKTLYTYDLVAWLDDTAIKLKQRRFDDLAVSLHPKMSQQDPTPVAVLLMEAIAIFQ